MTPYAFGPFTVDVDAAELRNGQEKIALRPKCFDLLVDLLAHRGKLVTKEQLMERVWSDVVVNDATISRTVAALRAALGDDSSQPQYIETVSRRGYKFIGELSDEKSAPPEFMLIHEKKEYPLRRGSQIIGRGRDADILLYTPATSRHHARVDVTAGGAKIIDLESRHGTFVNGKRIHGSVQLAAGDQIEIGGERLVLWSPASETSRDPPSVDRAR